MWYISKIGVFVMYVWRCLWCIFEMNVRGRECGEFLKKGHLQYFWKWGYFLCIEKKKIYNVFLKEKFSFSMWGFVKNGIWWEMKQVTGRGQSKEERKSWFQQLQIIKVGVTNHCIIMLVYFSKSCGDSKFIHSKQSSSPALIDPSAVLMRIGHVH